MTCSLAIDKGGENMRWLSNLCGGTISAKDLILACIGCAATVLLVLSLVFCIAVIFTPHY